MPLEWTNDHALRMVTVIAEGEVTLGQSEEYLDAVVVADAMPYAKLVDCTNMVTHASDDDMMQLVAGIRAYATVLQGGPLCFVVATPEMLDYTRRYINLSIANRPVQICKTVEALQDGGRSQRLAAVAKQSLIAKSQRHLRARLCSG